MLGAIVAPIANILGGKLIDRLGGAWEAYLKKEISKDELTAKMVEAIVGAVSEIEVAHADALAKTYASFMDAMKTSKLLQVVWATTMLSQLFVLVWHQWGIPFIVFMKWTASYPASGSTVEWAYLLLAAGLGLGPVVLRNGPGAGHMLERMKALLPSRK
jgi:hypothetical protein